MVKENYRNKLNGNDLDLSLMSLTEIPVKEIAALPKATLIDLSCNHITSIPAPFCNLKHIVKLDLSRNEISFLPEAFGDLRKLQNLDLYNNKLQMLPVSFCQLQNLKWLDLKNNPLTPQLKKIAGDCLDAKQCQSCAKNVVLFMQNVQNQLLAQQEENRKKQEELEALRKIQEERENEAQRKAKKAAKERKRATLLADKKNKQKQQDSFSSDSGTNVKSEDSYGSKKEAKQNQQLNSGGMGCVGFLVKILVVLLTIVSVAIGLLFIYTKGDFSEASIQHALRAILKDAHRLIAYMEDVGRQFLAWLQSDGVHIMKIIFSYCNAMFWDVVEIVLQIWNHLMDRVAVISSNLKAA